MDLKQPSRTSSKLHSQSINNYKYNSKLMLRKRLQIRTGSHYTHSDPLQFKKFRRKKADNLARTKTYHLSMQITMQLHITCSMRGLIVRQAVPLLHPTNKHIAIALTIKTPLRPLRGVYSKKYRHRCTELQVLQIATNVRCMRIQRRYSLRKIQ